MKRIPLIALLALAGCASTAEVTANHEAKCAVLSDSPEAHADCLSRLAQVHRRDQQRAVAAFIFAGDSGQGGSSAPAPSAYVPTAPTPVATLCVKQGEYVSGMNRVCTYSCNGSAHAETYPAATFCPQTIRR